MNDFQTMLHIRNDVPPVTQPHRRVPSHVRKQIDGELQCLKGLDIIEKVDGCTLQSFLLVVRICVEMIISNQAI